MAETNVLESVCIIKLYPISEWNQCIEKEERETDLAKIFTLFLLRKSLFIQWKIPENHK